MANRRPITFLIPTLEPGGAERKTVILANGFAARGREVDLCLLREADGLLRDEVHPAVRIVPLAIRRTRYFFPPIRHYLRRTRPRILVCVMHHAAVFGIISRTGSGTRTPVVIIEGGMNLTVLRETTPLRFQLFRIQIGLLYRRAARIFVNAAQIGDELVTHAGLSPQRIECIPNPSASAVFSDTSRPELSDWPDDGVPVAVAVSRLDDNKDIATLLRAFAAVRAIRPLQLVVLGEGPERGALERQATALGVTDQVHFLGTRQRPWHYVRRAALFVLPSRTEGFSNALVEALAVGCPVIATDAPGGNAYVLDGGRYGKLVPVGDDEALAGAMIDMLDNPPDPQLLIARAREFAEHQVDHYLEAIERYAD